MSITSDTITLFTRELLIYKKNLVPSIARAVIFPLIFILLLGSIGNIPKNVPVTVVNYNENGAGSMSFINLLESGGSR